MKVLFGCEESGVCRDQWLEHGHDAWSCDLLPSRRKQNNHLQGDVFQVMSNAYYGSWDIIFLFPPCTHLAVSGNRWYGTGTPGYAERVRAIQWTKDLWMLAKSSARIGVGFENPIGVFSKVEKPTQIIQPWQFGHGETKATCLWLHGLPKLQPTNVVNGREQRIWKMAPSPTRQRDRSITYSGIAKAMADQWGGLQ